jgi:hypothetical protein
MTKRNQTQGLFGNTIRLDPFRSDFVSNRFAYDTSKLEPGTLECGTPVALRIRARDCQSAFLEEAVAYSVSGEVAMEAAIELQFASMRNSNQAGW